MERLREDEKLLLTGLLRHRISLWEEIAAVYEQRGKQKEAFYIMFKEGAERARRTLEKIENA